MDRISEKGTRPGVSAYATLVAAQLAVGAAAIFARFALHGAGPIVVAALRLAIAGLPLLALSWPQSKKLAIPRNHELLLAFSGIALAVHFATWIGSLLYTSVAVSTLLVSTAPVWTAVYDVVVLKQKFNRAFWLAILAGGCGLLLIVGARNSTAPVTGLESLGNLLAAAGGVAFAGYLIAIRSISNLYPTIVIVGRTFSWSALTLTITAICVRQMPPGNDITSWAGILAMAFISQILGHTGMNACLRWFPSSTVALSTLLEPVFAAILASFIFAENLSAQTIFGSLLVLTSLAVTLRNQPENVRQQAAASGSEL